MSKLGFMLLILVCLLAVCCLIAAALRKGLHKAAVGEFICVLVGTALGVSVGLAEAAHVGVRTSQNVWLVVAGGMIGAAGGLLLWALCKAVIARRARDR